MPIIITSNPRYFVYLRYFFRQINRKFHIKKLWHWHNGDWHWLREKQVSIASINRSLWRLSVPSFSFHFMLALSAIIATLGLLANSAAVIIGAMIIAPLMGPIVGIAYSTAMGNRKLLRRSSLTVLKGVLLTVIASWATAEIIGLETVDSEILSRTNPTLIDFGIAMAAGMAGAFTNTRRSISDAIPGVAIAVALVPPISVVGIGLALGENSIAMGAGLLFFTNLICIVFFGGLVFLFQSYGSIERAKKGLALSTFVMFILGFPLSLSMRELIIEKNVRLQISNLIVEEINVFDNADIRSIVVIPRRKAWQINIEVAAPMDSISQVEIDHLKQFISQKLNQSIELRVEVIPVRVLQSSAN